MSRPTLIDQKILTHPLELQIFNKGKWEK